MHGTHGESRAMDQLRTDVGVDYLNGITPDAAPSGGSVDVTLTMQATTELADYPGELAGFGPVIADVARQIANDSEKKLRVVIYDDVTGEPTHVATPTRQPTAQQQRRVEVCDTTCVFPGCRMPARRCDIDHTTAATDGGATPPRR